MSKNAAERVGVWEGSKKLGGGGELSKKAGERVNKKVGERVNKKTEERVKKAGESEPEAVGRVMAAHSFGVWAPL
jgi:hypothetical protein